jgi:23S rRNA pseudouridine1911/1915/1917 synthase
MSTDQTIEHYSITVPEDAPVTMRVDSYIASAVPELSRSRIALDTTEILIDGRPVKKSRKISGGVHIEIAVQRQEMPAEPEDVDFPVLYENEHVVVVNKPQGLVVHPAAGNWHGTLVHGLLYRYQQMKTLDTQRPGIVHRLDKDTSGVMIVAKDAPTIAVLSKQFSTRSAQKVYIAIVQGTPKKKRDTIETQIVRDRHDRKRFVATEMQSVGKYAQTSYTVLRTFEHCSLVRLTLKTGRTHQLRVHMRYIGNPIVGDPIYAKKQQGAPDATLMLHALSLEIDIPEGEGRVRRKFIAPLPKRFREYLKPLRS